MFSEYASKFLAQSQSRLSNFGQPDAATENPYRQTPDRSSRPTRHPHRSILARGYTGNPYQAGGSRFGQLGFASRMSTAHEDAPLFHSTLNEYAEDDDDEERDRDAADLFALQRSRRVAAASKLAESTDTEPDASRGSLEESHDAGGPSRKYSDRGPRRGIRSSWNGGRSGVRGGRGDANDVIDEEAESIAHDHKGASRESTSSSDGNHKMVDVGLDSQTEYDDPPASLTGELEDDNNPPAFQKFQGGKPERDKYMLRRQSTQESDFDEARRASEDEEPLPTAPPQSDGDIFKYDPFFAWLFLILLAALLSTFVLVWLHTSRRKGMGDTIYTTLSASFHMLAVDTLVSVIVALLWLAALRSFARPLTVLIIIAVPVIMSSFSIYAFASSYKGQQHGASFQDRVMRWAAMVPGAAAVIWVLLVVKTQRSIRQAIDILEFSGRILAANSALLLLGFACLVLIVTWTWIWMGMFTRVFLGGYFSQKLARFIISVSSWWLGVWFVLMYMWTVGVINSVQRATTAATVSQWYFHRNAAPSPSSNEVVLAALNHAVTTIFGSLCQQSFLALAVRAPLLVLPRRLAGIVEAIAAHIVPTPITALTNPLTITYSAIHSQNLQTSARGLSRMEFLTPNRPTTTLTPHVVFNTVRGARSSPTLPYRLAKLLLYATRFIMATALGFAGWVMTAKQLRLAAAAGSEGGSIRGSAYAYVVGIVASFIGFSVMGAMENILGGIVDATVICYGSEKLMMSGNGGYCMEAAALFGERRTEFHDERGLP